MPNSPGLTEAGLEAVSPPPTTEVDVPMTSEDVEVEMLAADDDDEDHCFFVDVTPVLLVRLLLMLPQSTGRFARV